MLRYCTPLLLIVIATAALVGCKSGSSGPKTPTSTQTATAIPPSPTPDLAQPDAIRGVNLEEIGDVRKIEVESGGARLDPRLLIYADVTGDGNEDAIVPISLGGKSNITAFVVLTPDVASRTHVRAIFTEPGTGVRRGIALRVENGKLIETQGLPGLDDPECCPSMLKVITFDWNGTMLVAGDTKTIPNPSGGVKGTPVATAAQ